MNPLLDEILTDAYGDEQQLWAFRQAFETNIPTPCRATVIGEVVTVLGFDYDGNARRGVTVRCRRSDGATYFVPVADVVPRPRSKAAPYFQAYCEWMGVVPPKTKSRTKPAAEFVILSVGTASAIGRPLAGDEPAELKLSVTKLFPGAIASVKGGKVTDVRIDAGALGLTPLVLHDFALWDPKEEYWGENGKPSAKWEREIAARGPRPMHEFELVLPGYDWEDPEDDPISQAVDAAHAGDLARSREILMDLCRADLRCLDAHAHLGNLLFDRRPEKAIHHYEVGVRIGELSLGGAFEGVLSWGCLDNRPFLRCLHGYGLCLWRLEEFKAAAEVFRRMLWFNPGDNQGVRFIVGEVSRRKPWHPGY
jgi:hypothetical protein